MEGGYRMSREIDERIVAMYFDNRNFEKGAQQTIQTLDELKKSLNMESVGKGIKSFGDISKKLNLDKVQKSADKLKTTFGGFGDALKKSANVALGPLNSLKGAFDELNGYIGKVFGIDLASKVVGGLENAFRNLTVAPISAGWQQYENTMDSVKTIMSSTGETIDVVKAKLNEMTNYANKTIYSLNDMTSNLGKFTNNGVKLDDATNAMIGLANAAADAGQGAAQASMAMYNVSQAIGVGKMLSIDWKSLENANIATVKLKQTLIDSAVAAGTLEKKMVKNEKTGKEELQYWTKAEKGAKAAQVTVEGFRDSLSKGWLTKDAMLNTFAIYSGQLTATEIAALGYSREESERLAKIGEEAMKAAQEVRTFSKMMDALKEGVQSSWATSFEYIFGDMQEGTNLWTKMNTEIEGLLNKSSENRNGILATWRGMAKDENGNFRSIKQMYDEEVEAAKKVFEDAKKMAENPMWQAGYTPTQKERDEAAARSAEKVKEAEAKYQQALRDLEAKYAQYGDPSTWVDYRQSAIEALLGIRDGESGELIKAGLFQDLQAVAEAVKGAFSDVFGTFDSDTLINITKRFSEFVETFTSWLGDASDANSRLSKIRNGLSGVFTVGKIGLEIFKTGFGILWKIIKPIIDPLLNLLNKFGDFMNLKSAKNLGEMLKTLGTRFGELWKKLTNLGWEGAFGKIGDWFGNLWEKIRTGVTKWLNDNGLGGVVDWFVDLGDKIKAGYQIVADWWNDPKNGMATFFKGMWDSIVSWFVAGEEGGDVPIVAFFKNIGIWIEGAWNSTVESLTLWWAGGENDVAVFFKTMWETIKGWFATGENGEDAPIVGFFKNIYDWIKNAWEETYSSISAWWTSSENTVSKFFTTMWETIKSWFYAGEEGEDVPIVQFFKRIYDWIVNAWNTTYTLISEWWASGENEVVSFFTTMWGTIKSWFVAGEKGEDLPIVKFFKNIYEWIKKAWEDTYKNIYRWWDGGENDVAKFFTKMWETIKGWFATGENGEDAPIVGFFKNIYNWIKNAWDDTFVLINDWWKNGDNDVVKFFTDMWNSIMSAFGPGEGGGNGGSTEEAPIVSFFRKLSEDLRTIWDGIIGWKGWESVATFFSDIWGWIIGLFKGDDSVVAGSEEIAVAIKDGERKAKALEESQGFFDQIGAFFGTIFTSLTESIHAIGSVPEARAIIETVYDIIQLILGCVQKVVDWLGKVTGANGEEYVFDVHDWIIPALIGIAGIAGEFISYKKAGNLAKIAEAGGAMTNFGGEILKVAAGVLLLALAVRYLGTIPTDQLIKGGVAVIALGAVMAVLINSTNSLNKTLNKRIMPETSGERIAKHAITAVTIAGTIAEVMALLPNILDKLKEFDSNVNGDAIFKTFSGIAIMIGSLILSIAVFNKLGGGQMNVAAAAQGALAIVVGLGILLVGFDAVIGTLLGFDEALAQVDNEKFGGLHKQHLERIKAGGETLAAMAEAIGGFLGALGGGIAGGFNKVKATKDSEAVVSAADILKNVSVEDMQHMADVVGILSDIQEAIPDYDNIWDKWINGDKLGILGDNVGRLGEGLGRMVIALNPSELDPNNDISRLKDYIHFLNAFGSVADVLFNSVSQISYLFGGQTFYNPDLLSDSNTAFSTLMAYYEDAAEGLAEAIQRGLGEEGTAALSSFSFDSTSIITAICRSLEQNGSEKVAAAVRTMINAGLASYGGANEFGNPYIHSTEQIDKSLTKIFELMTAGGENAGLDTVLSGFLGDLGDSSKLNSLLGQFNDVFDTFGATISDKLNGSIHFDMDKWLQTDENGKIPALENLETQWNTAIAQFEESGGANFELQIRPVIDMTEFGTEAQKLQTYFNGALPLSINASFALGTQKLPIEDTTIVSELQALRTEVVNARLFIQSAVNNAGVSVGNRITSLGSDIRQMKFYLDTNLLIGGIIGGVDKGLGERADLYSQTRALPVRNTGAHYVKP